MYNSFNMIVCKKKGGLNKQQFENIYMNVQFSNFEA